MTVYDVCKIFLTPPPLFTYSRSLPYCICFLGTSSPSLCKRHMNTPPLQQMLHHVLPSEFRSSFRLLSASCRTCKIHLWPLDLSLHQIPLSIFILCTDWSICMLLPPKSQSESETNCLVWMLYKHLICSGFTTANSNDTPRPALHYKNWAKLQLKLKT